MKKLQLLMLLLCFVGSFSLVAQIDTFQFDTDEQQQRFRRLSDELRCPMCQNTNLTGSTGGVAEDLRREVHRMIIEGWTDAEIEQFMFDRYGDFIFYRPRLRAETVLLWFGPLIFLLIGAWMAFGILRKARIVDQAELDLDPTQQQQLQDLLEKMNPH
ncbi:MAG: cytochrome c-type biogenesis protein CcmH [Gammaproteobacteria bacterium]|jgi:cytochrome c-type biogenesis protein CcmH|nr:cytochrome c-type biogenesis protein CcmH [Gammaproteobacteria bacterium]MDP6096652.1 cytochrome c-type biogenesis protein CcmH [Gammaproteobacteria bacterium]HJO12800.1 cytochrome c-type biogenesis protein [Gammaproteobacteria bacterium]|tara:strand:- start:10859 stop:11332 length:474 start_codon:yes stop_codon:yes gene_type:complete